MTQRAIFISSFNPFILRNLLAGDMLEVLKTDANNLVVVLVPEYKKDFFEKEIAAPNVVVEGVRAQPISRRDILFRFLTGSLVDTLTILVNKHVQLDRDGRHFRFFVSWVLMKLFSRLSGFKRLVRLLDYVSVKKDYYSGYFAQYQPQLVFATDVFNDMDVGLLAEAKSRGVKTAGMIRSWDNLTTKGMFRIKPDHLLVHNDILSDEAVRHCDMAKDRIVAVGMPQYDRYINDSRMSRERFFKKLNFDPNRKLILFSPFGQRFTDTDWQIMEMLKTFIETDQIPPAQVLVRLTPNDRVSLGDSAPGRYFYIDRPGHGFTAGRFNDQELTGEGMDWLADCLCHADAVVAGGASIGIDAAVFGKPTILIHFDGFMERPYWQSVRRFLRYQHLQTIIEFGAMRSVTGAGELRRQLNNHLVDPALDKPAREKMLLEQCWKLDGRSGWRIGNFLGSLLSLNYETLRPVILKERSD